MKVTQLNTGAARKLTSGHKSLRTFRQGKVNARRYLVEENRIRSVRSRRLQKKLETSFRKDLRIIISQIKSGVRPDFDASLRRKENEIRAAVSAETKKLFTTILENNDRKYKPVLTKTAVDLGMTFDRNAWIDRWSREYLLGKEPVFAGISQSMTLGIMNDISSMEEEGLGVDAIARRLNRDHRGIGRRRAALIARTETHNASGFAQHNYHKDLSEVGIQMVKQWVATADERTRSAHAAMNGKTALMDEPFMMPNGREMDYVGDPKGGAANVINCRCVILYVDAEDSDDVEDEKLVDRMEFAGKLEQQSIKPNNTVADYEKVMTEMVTARQVVLQKALPVPNFQVRYGPNKRGEIVHQGYYESLRATVTTEAYSRAGYTLTHEYGHHIDYALLKVVDKDLDPFQGAGMWKAWSETSSRFKNAYNRDKKLQGLGAKERWKNIRRWREKLYNDNFDLKDDAFGNYSDIIDAMTNGVAQSTYGFFGHGKKYYRNTGMKYKETFANLYSLRGTKFWPEVKKEFPNLTEIFDEIIEEAIDVQT